MDSNHEAWMISTMSTMSTTDPLPVKTTQQLHVELCNALAAWMMSYPPGFTLNDFEKMAELIHGRLSVQIPPREYRRSQ